MIRFWIVIAAFVMALTWAGCGRKAPPLPPEYEAVPVVTSLTGSLSESVVTLTWTIPGGKDSRIISGFQIFRSRTDADTPLCDDCPVVFQRIGNVSNNTRTYSEKIDPGMHYIYKVVAFASNGALGEDSPFFKIETRQRDDG